MNKSRIVMAAAVAMVIGTTVAVTLAVNASTSPASSTGASHRAKPVRIEVFAPERGANAGANGFGWFVDMEVDFLGKNLHQAGFSALQLTGPGVHTNAAPFPGTFSTGQDDRMPGLVVLTSTTNNTRPGFSGPGTNLANLFNLTGITNRDSKETELWDTWIVGAARREARQPALRPRRSAARPGLCRAPLLRSGSRSLPRPRAEVPGLCLACFAAPARDRCWTADQELP
jgi:hypothetical protein